MSYLVNASTRLLEHHIADLVLGAVESDLGRKVFSDAKGLLLANKQIRTEATHIYFTRNTFALMISSVMPGMCQRC